MKLRKRRLSRSASTYPNAGEKTGATRLKRPSWPMTVNSCCLVKRTQYDPRAAATALRCLKSGRSLVPQFRRARRLAGWVQAIEVAPSLIALGHLSGRAGQQRESPPQTVALPLDSAALRNPGGACGTLSRPASTVLNNHHRQLARYAAKPG